MSDQKTVSPLLDGFTLGNPMSSRSGVRCYPAIKENSDKKYIVKAISIPASQVQLDALLLTGAYSDPADAMDYFKSLADGVLEEVEWLQKLSRLEGFLPYEGRQVEPMENGQLGYRVFLVGSFKRSLDKFMRRSPLTHLQAVNLGLDLCAALAICRRAGLLYVDLKPTNVYISEDKEFRIGDLGFVKLDSLQFTSLPTKFVSPYSPPELQDAMNPINETADIYALGMMLYQIYNDGQLPFRGKAPAGELTSPCNADYEIAEIILKAIHPDVKQRWANPLEMGKALAAYLQRNTVNNTPISVPAEPVVQPDPLPEEPAPVEAVSEEPQPEAPAVEAPEEPQAEPAMEETQVFTPPQEPVTGETQVFTPIKEAAQLPSDLPENKPEPIPEPKREDVQAQLDRILVGTGATGTFSIPGDFSHADMDEEDLFNFDLEGLDLRDYEEIYAPRTQQPPQLPDEPQAYTDPIEEPGVTLTDRRTPGWVKLLLTVLILGGLAFGGYWYYQNMYLQTIDQMTVEGDMQELIVTLDTMAEESMLSVSCTDTYGNSVSSPVEYGQARFTDLKPGTQYRLEVQIEGFHGLTGFTSQYFTTSNITNVVSFTAVTGAEDGSAMLTFTVDGADPEEWTVIYGTDDEDYQAQTFTGHSVTIRELTVGKTYSFYLQCEESYNLTGQTEATLTASRLVLASGLRILSCVDGNLTVCWNGPEDVEVTGWTVRCTDEAGVQQMVTTDQCQAVVPSIDTTKAYTIEVTADGMTQAARASISANPLTIGAIDVDTSDPQQLTVSWDYEGAAPEGGWLLMYSIDVSDYQSVIKCEEPTAVIAPRIHGATYYIEIRSASGVSIFDNVLEYDSPNARIFDQYNLPADKITANLLATPENQDWNYRNVEKEDFTTTFQVGTPISVLLEAKKDFSLAREDVSILYVIRDSSSNVITELIGQETVQWWDMWAEENYHYCELNLPNVPQYTGSYNLSLYFNGYAIMSIDFTITQ